MYFFKACPDNDPTNEKKVAALRLNEEQKIYFENKMQNCIENLMSKYNVEFNTEGIHIIMDHKTYASSLASK